jgi:two-component system, cell cycle sensor histidine kinase and response regulator CckA
MAFNDRPRAILVVEDDAALRRLVVKMLKGAGFTTLSAGRAADGLSIIRDREGGLDLAIIDIVMPGMSGLDLASDIDREYPELKILYISGYVDSVATEVLSRRAPDHVLLKPFTREALLQRVNLLLGSGSGEPAHASEHSATASRRGTSG